MLSKDEKEGLLIKAYRQGFQDGYSRAGWLDDCSGLPDADDISQGLDQYKQELNLEG